MEGSLLGTVRRSIEYRCTPLYLARGRAWFILERPQLVCAN